MRRRRPPVKLPRRPRPADGGRPGGRRHGALIAMGIALYLLVVWFGVVIIGDNPVRSALFAAVIVAIAAIGYRFSRPQTPKDRR